MALIAGLSATAVGSGVMYAEAHHPHDLFISTGDLIGAILVNLGATSVATGVAMLRATATARSPAEQ